MVKINKVTTRSGDGGETGIFGPGRVRKDSSRIEAIGSVDEVSSALGMLRSLKELKKIPGAIKIIATIQNDLFDLGSELAAADGHKSPCPISTYQVIKLENFAQALNKKNKPLTSFILPGGSTLNAWLHLARATTRRAERAVVKFASETEINPLLQVYLNRLSDLLFVMARAASRHQKVKEILWKPGGS